MSNTMASSASSDAVARMTLDISDVVFNLNQVSKMMSKTMAQVQTSSVQSSKAMTKSSENFMHVSRGHARTFSLEWFKRFGEVAIGFTLAYRAMNVFGAGLLKIVDTYKTAIVEGSELAEVQAKLAFWYTMYSKDTMSYTEAFKHAAVNISALGDASVYSISTIGELATGLDEMAQSVGSLSADLIPAMADMVDFTVMVAKTTGSSTRQVRQEFQALMEGRIRTTDVMARALIKTGIMTRAELKQMRNMTNQAQILDKVLRAVSLRWGEARDTMLRASVDVAFPFWEKAVRRNIRLAVELASAIENTGKKVSETGNLFALVFYKHAKKLLADSSKGMYENVLVMRLLRDILDSVLTSYEKIISAVSTWISIGYRLSDTTVSLVKAFAGFFILTTILKLTQGLGRILLWLAMGPVVILTRALQILKSTVLLTYGSFLLLPAVVYLTSVAFFAFFKTIGGQFEAMGKDVKEFVSLIPEFFSWSFGRSLHYGSVFVKAMGRLFSSLTNKWADSLQAQLDNPLYDIPAYQRKLSEGLIKVLRDAKDIPTETWAYWKKKYEENIDGMTDFTVSFGKNFKSILLSNFEEVEKLLAPIWAKMTTGNADKLKELMDSIKKEAVGLESIFKTDAEETSKELSARMRKERQVLSLQKQMQKDISSFRLMEIERSADDELDIRLLKIEEMRLAEDESLKLRSAAFDAYLEKTRIIHGNFTQGMSRGIQKYVDGLKTNFEMGVYYAEESAKAMQGAFSELFFDVMMDEFKSWGDYLKSLLRGLSSMLSELLSQMLMMTALDAAGISPSSSFFKMFAGSLLGSSFGGGGAGSLGGTPTMSGGLAPQTFGTEGMWTGMTGTFHDGRIPFSVLPRYHDGLLPGEIPAIIKNDESVLTPNQMTSLLSDKGGNNFNISITAVDAASFMELARRNPQAIIRPIVEAITNNDTSLKGSIQMAVK